MDANFSLVQSDWYVVQNITELYQCGTVVVRRLVMVCLVRDS